MPKSVPWVERLLRRDRWIAVSALVLAVTVSVAFTLAGGGTGMSPVEMTAHTGPGGALIAGMDVVASKSLWSPGYFVVIVFMWWMMMIAMMVPSAAPTILLYGALHAERSISGALEFLSGYLGIWLIFSLAATTLQFVLAAGGLVSPMYMNVVSPFLGAFALLTAGLYQLTPLKAACLESCRGPVDTLTRHRRVGPAAAFRMGTLHGTFCLGCCWAIMLLLFVGGVMNLWWIIGITFYVALEKLAPFGERLVKPAGAVLLLSGIALLLRAADMI